MRSDEAQTKVGQGRSCLRGWREANVDCDPEPRPGKLRERVSATSEGKSKICRAYPGPSGGRTRANNGVGANQTTRTYLARQKRLIRTLEKGIKAQIEREAWLRSRLERVTTRLDGMPRVKGTDDFMSRGLAEIEEVQASIRRDEERLAQIRDGLKRILDAIPHDMARLAAQMCYLDGLTVEDLAERMDISVRWGFMLLKQAAEAVEIIMARGA